MKLAIQVGPDQRVIPAKPGRLAARVRQGRLAKPVPPDPLEPRAILDRPVIPVHPELDQQVIRVPRVRLAEPAQRDQPD